jgi:hypothetical protein
MWDLTYQPSGEPIYNYKISYITKYIVAIHFAQVDDEFAGTKPAYLAPSN